jgi:hypothetical protein
VEFIDVVLVGFVRKAARGATQYAKAASDCDVGATLVGFRFHDALVEPLDVIVSPRFRRRERGHQRGEGNEFSHDGRGEISRRQALPSSGQ